MGPDPLVLWLAVALPFVGATAAPLLHRLLGERTGYAGAVVALASFVLVGSQLGREGAVTTQWIPSLEVAATLYVDGWALLFASLASGIGVLVFTYAGRYMHGEDHLARFYGTLLAFMGSILGVALAADLVVLFVFWELTSLCSFVLIGHYTDDDDSRYSARMAMFVTVGGGLFLLVGVVLLAIAAEAAFGGITFDLARMLADSDAMATALRENGLFVPALALFTVAAGAKSAQVPLHFWLPNAMVAPTPVSAFLHSATMVKVGVYFLGRVRPLFVGPEWTLVVATVGLVTMTVAALLAVVAVDLKELLAYSTASHLGLMVAGFGFANHYGAEAGSFHLLNHALFKAALFLVAGVVAHEAGSRRLTDLSGLWRELPVTAAVTVVAGLSMAGIPPFNGFYSKELLFEAAYEAAVHTGGLAWLYPVVAVFASVFTVLYSLRFLSIFFGERRWPIEHVHRPPLALVGPPVVLGALAAVVSVAPGLAVDVIVQAAVDATAVGEPEVHVGLPTSLSVPVAMSAVAVVGGVAAYPFVGRIVDVLDRLTASAAVQPSRWYGGLVAYSESASAGFGPWVHNGTLRTYVVWVLTAASLLVLTGYVATYEAIPQIVGLTVTPAMALVLAVALVAALAVTIAPSHVVGVLTLSILGFMVAIFFILASAPDLALTQLVVETLLLVIFLLVLEELPTFYADLDRGVAVRDAVLSAVVGLTAFTTVLLTLPDSDTVPTELAREYTEQAIPGAEGHNVVNVILVDFRGFDTLGESIVVAIAAISVLVLIIMRTRGENQ